MKKIILLFIAVFSGIGLYAEELESLVGADRAAILLQGDTITELQSKKPEPALIPDMPGVQNIIQTVRNSFSPNIMVESLYIYKKPAEANQGTWTTDERTAVYNNALALSSLAGIQYYSTSRKTMRTFYETSAVIDNPETKTPRKDPTYFIPPRELIIYARQKDGTFGDNIYKYTYHTEDKYLVFIQENLTTMTAGIIPVIGKNKLHSVVAVIDAGEHLLIYVVSMADAASVPGMGQRVGESFSTRAEAILNWFTGQADQGFKSAGKNR